MARGSAQHRMRRAVLRLLVLFLLFGSFTVIEAAPASACPFRTGCDPELTDGAAVLDKSDSRVAGLVGGDDAAIVNYEWRLRSLCMLSDEANGVCSPMDFRDCPQEPGRVIGYYLVQRRLIVRSDGMMLPADGADGAVLVPSPAGLAPGDPVSAWITYREGCLDITSLNPPPSPAEVFSYFQRLPLPTLTTQHQPPGDGLTGLPVIFYTDSPTTQTFTVDIRGFSVVINATAEQYTWHTGDPRTPVVTSSDPGQPYPDQTIEHPYRS